MGWHDAKLASDALKQAQRLIHALQHDPKQTLPNCVSEVEVGPTHTRVSLDLVGAGLGPSGTAHTEVVIKVPAERKRCGMAVRLTCWAAARLPGRTSPYRPAMRRSMNRVRHLSNVCLAIFSRAALALFGSPSALANTRRARLPSAAGSERLRAND